MSVQRIVEDSPAIELQAEAQHTSGEIETPVRFHPLCLLAPLTLSVRYTAIFAVLLASW